MNGRVERRFLSCIFDPLDELGLLFLVSCDGVNEAVCCDDEVGLEGWGGALLYLSLRAAFVIGDSDSDSAMVDWSGVILQGHHPA